MLRFDLPYTDTSLLLTPRFGGHSPLVQGMLLALCLLPIVLVGWLYRYELRLVRRAAAGVLLSLRLLVVVMLVFMVAFRPVAARPVAETVPGRVVVGLDLSDSMGVTDPQRPLADKLRLARALGLARDLCSDAEIDGWIREPSADRMNPDTRRRFDAVCQRVDGLTRAQIARAVLAPDGAGLLAAIDRHQRPDLLGFAARGTPLDPA